MVAGRKKRYWSTSCCFSLSPNGMNVSSSEAAAWVIEAVGTAPPRKVASAEPSVSMSTAACCVALSGEKSS